MSECRNRSTLLNHQFYEIGLELALLDDKIEDVFSSGYSRYIKDVSNSSCSLEYLMDKKVRLQQQKNNIAYKIKLLNNRN